MNLTESHIRVMKHTALLFLTAIYLLSCLGIGVDRFYCCGRLTSVTLTYASADHTDQDNCCKHESKSFKIKDSHVTVNTTVLSLSMPVIPMPAYQTAVNIQTEQEDPAGYQVNGPPGNPGIPIYTLNCTYRI